MASLTRAVVALMLVALQLGLSGWGPCVSSADGMRVADAAGNAAQGESSAGHHHGAPTPASDEGTDPRPHAGDGCPTMGACGPAGIHEVVAVQADHEPHHRAVSTRGGEAPEFTPLSPEPPPPRG